MTAKAKELCERLRIHARGDGRWDDLDAKQTVTLLFDAADEIERLLYPNAEAHYLAATLASRRHA